MLRGTSINNFFWFHKSLVSPKNFHLSPFWPSILLIPFYFNFYRNVHLGGMSICFHTGFMWELFCRLSQQFSCEFPDHLEIYFHFLSFPPFFTFLPFFLHIFLPLDHHYFWPVEYIFLVNVFFQSRGPPPVWLCGPRGPRIASSGPLGVRVPHPAAIGLVPLPTGPLSGRESSPQQQGLIPRCSYCSPKLFKNTESSFFPPQKCNFFSRPTCVHLPWKNKLTKNPSKNAGLFTTHIFNLVTLHCKIPPFTFF